MTKRTGRGGPRTPGPGKKLGAPPKPQTLVRRVCLFTRPQVAWLLRQPGGISGTIRTLVEAAMAGEGPAEGSGHNG